MWVKMNSSSQPYSCYAEVVLLKRRSSATSSYEGRVFAHTTYDVTLTKQQIQNLGTSGNFTQGGFVGNITIGSGGNLQFNGGGATLTVPNFQCFRISGGNTAFVNPTGFYEVDRGFEGNTTASVWTNGASMGKTMERSGSGNYQTSSNHYVPTGGATYSTWSTSYNPNDNQGTIIMFR
jgi:hypothetical protein